MSSRRRAGSWFGRIAAGGLALTFLVCLTAAPAGATGEGDATASGTISIVAIRDAMGAPIPVPMGFDIVPFTTGPDQGPDGPEAGTGAVTYGGTAMTTGMAETTQVALTSATNATASPAGEAEGIETVSGSIQFLNNTMQDIEVEVRFDWGQTASATVMDAALETAEAFLNDVEFQQTSGGSPTSPCSGGGLLIDEELTAGPAPPDDTPAGKAGALNVTVTIPATETCSYTALLQTAVRAEAEAAMVPTLPTLAAVLLALALAVTAALRLRREPGTAR